MDFLLGFLSTEAHRGHILVIILDTSFEYGENTRTK